MLKEAKYIKIKIYFLIFRDARSHDKYQIGIITNNSVEIHDLQLSPRWDVAKLVQGYE